MAAPWGHLAQQMQGRTPQSISVVRPLSAGVIRDFELCEAMLRYFIRKATRQGLRVKPRVLVAVPGCITPVEKRAVYNSALRAGAREVLVMAETTAAAIGAGLPITEPMANMICDIGGGTTDVAVLSLSEVVAERSIRTAGDAMDQALIDYLRRHYSLKVAKSTAERLRIDIGSASPLADELTDDVRGVDAISGLPRRAIVTSEEVREALERPLAEIVVAIKSTLDDCSTELVSELADNGLVLAGGGALLRGLEQYLCEQTGLPTRVCVEPLSAVARGHLHLPGTLQSLARRDAHQRRGCVRPNRWLVQQSRSPGHTRSCATNRASSTRRAAGRGGSCWPMQLRWPWCWPARPSWSIPMARTFAA